MSPFESGNVRWLMLFIKPRLLPEEKITVPRGSGPIIIQTTTVPSSSTRTATTSKLFVTKHRLRPPPLSSPATRGRMKEGLERLEQLERFEPQLTRPCHSMFQVPGPNSKLKTRNSKPRLRSLRSADHDLNQSAWR